MQMGEMGQERGKSSNVRLNNNNFGEASIMKAEEEEEWIKMKISGRCFQRALFQVHQEADNKRFQ